MLPDEVMEDALVVRSGVELLGVVTDALASAVPPREFEDALDRLPRAYGAIL